MGVLGGVWAVVGRRGGASAVLALWGCGGPWGGPAAGAGIVAGRRCLGAAVDHGGRWRCLGADGPWWWSVRCPAWAGPPAVHGAGAGVCSPLRLGCWRRCLASSLAGIMGAGGPAAVGVLFLFGSLPQVHSRVSGVPAGVFPALTRRGLAPQPQKPTKRAFPVSKNFKNTKRPCYKKMLYQNITKTIDK